MKRIRCESPILTHEEVASFGYYCLDKQMVACLTFTEQYFGVSPDRITFEVRNYPVLGAVEIHFANNERDWQPASTEQEWVDCWGYVPWKVRDLLLLSKLDLTKPIWVTLYDWDGVN